MTAAVATVPTVNPVTASIPGYALQQMQAQRRLQLAQALTQQAMTPVEYDPKGHMSWTQGLAKALSAGMGASMFNTAAAQEAALQTQGMQMMGAAYGMGAPGAAPPPSSPQALGAALDPRASAALAAGAQQGSVGPTTDNAARMDAMPAPAALPPAGPAPAAGGGGAPLNPMGLPPMLLWMASQGDPAAQEQVKTLLANRQTTNEQKNSQDPTIGASVRANLQTQNMTPLQKMQLARQSVPNGSPQAQQLDAAIAKENYIAPIEVKAGNLTMTPDGRTPLAYNPGLDKGINPTWSTSPSGYTTATGAAPVAGYAPAVGQIAGAEQRGKQENTLTTVPDASGAQHTVWGNGQAFAPSDAPPQFNLQGTPAQQISFLSNLAATDPNPKVRAAAGQRIAQLASGAAPSAMPAAPGMGVGPSSADAAIQKTTADAISGAPQQLQASKSAITGLETALRTLQNVPATGQGTIKTNEVIAAINNSLPASMQIRGDKNNQYQELAKYLSNSLNAAASGSSAGGSDARFESFMHGQPNAETMSKPALDSAIRYVLSQHDAAAARSQFLPDAYSQAKASGDPNAAMTAQQQWAQVYNPQVFAFSRMAPADRQAFKASLTPDQQQQFGAQYNAAHARGWVQ